MRVVGVIEQDDHRYIVNTSFSASEMEVIVNCGLRHLLKRGQLPLTKDEEGNLNIIAPHQKVNKGKDEDPAA